MSSKNEIANMAIGHLGIGKSITDFSTDRTSEADALRKYYDQALYATLRDFNWPFARKIATLSVSATDPPTNDWGYAYTYPSDCLRLLRIRRESQRVDTYDTEIPYQIYHADTEKQILTDEASAVAEYTKLVTDTSRFDEDFAIAFSYRLAIFIAPRVTGGDASALIRNVYQMYNYQLGLARQNAANEGGRDTLPESEFIRARS